MEYIIYPIDGKEIPKEIEPETVNLIDMLNHKYNRLIDNETSRTLIEIELEQWNTEIKEQYPHIDFELKLYIAMTQPTCFNTNVFKIRN